MGRSSTIHCDKKNKELIIDQDSSDPSSFPGTRQRQSAASLIRPDPVERKWYPSSMFLVPTL